MDSVEHALVLKEELVTNEEQHDLDKLGIAKNSREEKMRARDAKQGRSGIQRPHGCALSRSCAEGEARPPAFRGSVYDRG
jgi:hypothetical protein